MTVENFRPVKGLIRIYRCARTESLADVMSPQSVAECVILNQTGLIVDLRSKVERDDAQAQLWMDRFGFEALDITAGAAVSPPPQQPKTKRVLRIDVQPRKRMFEYMTKSWLTSTQQKMAPLLALFNPNSLHELRLEALNERGLAGLNEAILESGGEDLCLALKEMTKHLESFDTSIVIHCVQGKDRTGMLSMLCQSILGQSDQDIIDEYFQSDMHMRDNSVVALKVVKGRLDKSQFTGAPREAMVKTLDFIRMKYGAAACIGYLDSIGFDKNWRDRFIACQMQDNPAIHSKL